MQTGRYQVPKRKVQTRVHALHTGEERISFFLGELAETHAGPERPSDLLNGAGDFVVGEAEDGTIVFLQRRGLIRVTVTTSDELLDEMIGDETGSTATDEAVSVLLESGETIHGVARYELPDAQRRVQDFFNSSKRFVPIHRGDEIDLVNKDRIVRVTRRED